MFLSSHFMERNWRLR